MTLGTYAFESFDLVASNTFIIYEYGSPDHKIKGFRETYYLGRCVRDNVAYGTLSRTQHPPQISYYSIINIFVI